MIDLKLGAIEAGGTKFVCGIGDEKGHVQKQVRFPTTSPTETMAKVVTFFRQNPVDAIGIGSFGPIGVVLNKPDYGFITSTPKEGWQNYNFLGYMKSKLNVPYYWTTDVNVAAYGEYKLGAARGTKNLVYITIGTGIGAGIIYDDEFLQGYSHPEAGHILLHQNSTDAFSGVCPYHKNCFEGLASGPAIEARYGKKGSELATNTSVWKLEADYIAQACVDYTLILRPDRIVLGGGVMHQTQLFPLIRSSLKRQLNGYVEVPKLEEYIKPIALNDDAGMVGALLLARKGVQGIHN